MEFGAQLGLYGTNYWSNIRETVEALDAGRGVVFGSRIILCHRAIPMLGMDTP